MIGWRRGWRSARKEDEAGSPSLDPPKSRRPGAADAIDRAIALVVAVSAESLAGDAAAEDPDQTPDRRGGEQLQA